MVVEKRPCSNNVTFHGAVAAVAEYDRGYAIRLYWVTNTKAVAPMDMHTINEVSTMHATNTPVVSLAAYHWGDHVHKRRHYAHSHRLDGGRRDIGSPCEHRGDGLRDSDRKPPVEGAEWHQQAPAKLWPVRVVHKG